EADSDALPGFLTCLDESVFELENARRTLLRHFHARTLAPFGLTKWPFATAAAAAIIFYLSETQTASAEQLMRLTSYHTENFMTLDAQTVRSLEIFESGANTPTLLSTLDQTRTAMGGRLLRRWLRQPLLDVAEIIRRQEHIAWLVSHPKDRAELCYAFESIQDIERLSARARSGIASASDLLSLGQSLETIPRVRAVLHRDTTRFGQTLDALPACDEAAALIRRSISDELPTRAEQKGLIREGYSQELDQLRTLLREGKTYLAEMEQRERTRTGIKSLRVGYNKVFGYFIEVTRANLHLIPANYTHKQTLANAERFVTLELKEYESLVLNAQERITELESSLFRRVCAEVCKSREEMLAAAASIAYLDSIASLAEIAELKNYTRPVVNDTTLLSIKAGRHPVLEQMVEPDAFVPNDTELSGAADAQIALITGPNMSGKSTYLRQTALIVLLAQTGSFVPATAAVIGLCDRIFTRIGLYDRIGSGESTFMTEMIETAQILHHATPRSLILLDELGRGTSTYDGLAVARAVIEYIHNHPQLRSKTLFATHYHELTELAAILPRIENLYVEIAEQGSDLVFLYKLKHGSASKSYGVYAAKLAGLPRPVVRRAEQLLVEYENTGPRGHATSPTESATERPAHPSTRLAEIIRALQETDPNSLSPVEALMKLYELKRLAETEQSAGVRAVKSA
ncbi:MAG: DNA mismatch repair protein MutS, partial [Acidobacteria bacterium]|nr:DNA mismatch repair protein MutS [Acidobacteriota bacterium]